MVLLQLIIWAASSLFVTSVPEGFDAGGVAPLTHAALLEAWPKLLRSGNITKHMEVLRPLHIPFKESLPEGTYKKLSANVVETVGKVAAGGPGSGHTFKPLRFDDSIKLFKTSCQGANGSFAWYPAQTEERAIGERHVKKALHLSKGYSALIMDMNYVSKIAGRVCEDLAELFSSENCYVNWYITPVGSCAYLPHTDQEENFVVQLSGAKRWKFYNTSTLHPVLDLCNCEDDCRNEVDPVRAARDADIMGDGQLIPITLLPGDMLYFPRGMVHDAEVDPDFKKYGKHSSHLTLAVQPGLSWTSLLIGLVNASADDDPNFRKGIHKLACDDISSSRSLVVNADASSGAQKDQACPGKLVKTRKRWLDFVIFFIDFSARVSLDMRRMVSKGKKDAAQLVEGLQHILESLHDILIAREISHGSRNKRPSMQHPMLHMLQYANKKGLLGPSFNNKNKLGLAKGAWLDNLQSGLKSHLDVAFEGVLTGKSKLGNQSALLKKSMTLMKHSARKNKKERKSFNKDQLSFLSNWLESEQNGRVYDGTDLIPKFFL